VAFKKYNDNYSPGCQSCQQGRWLCIYLTYLCNANCAFCPAPMKNVDKISSAFGDQPPQILAFLMRHPFSGISFSGGDCLLVFDRLLEWLKFFKYNLPEIYYWLYTNGLEVEPYHLEQLARAGLDEIRFNIAATHYNTPTILEKIAMATDIINHVAVEIPSIPTDYEKLVEVLPYLDQIKVKYLNLHEYLLVPDDPLLKTESSGTFIFNKHTKLKYHAYSLQNTEKIKRFCEQRGFKLKINKCSLQKKEYQMLKRRITLGTLLRKKHEQLTEEGLLETCLVYPESQPQPAIQDIINAEGDEFDRYLVHPEQITAYLHQPKLTITRLSFLPPLSINDKRVLLNSQVINKFDN